MSKGEDPTQSKNWRPVNNLGILSKVVEKVINKKSKTTPRNEQPHLHMGTKSTTTKELLLQKCEYEQSLSFKTRKR